MRLYCACLSGISSQLEQTWYNEDRQFRGDVYASDAKTFRLREAQAVKRAFRLATLAFDELQIVEQFNSKL